MVISEGLKIFFQLEITCGECWTTYRATRSPLEDLDCLLLRMKAEELTRPPRSLENSDRLSRTLTIAAFHSMASGLVVGRTSSALMILSLMNKRSSGGVGMYRIRTPRGIETKPSANEMPQ